MKLLSGTQITEKKNAEKLLEIKEGVKLATRVDTLRSTAASEEAKLEAYRVHSMTFTLDQIDELLRKQRLAEQDLLIVQAEATRLRQPLDAEWTKLDEAIAVHRENVKWFTKKLGALLDRETLAEKRENTLDVMEQTLSHKESANEDTHNEAQKLFAEARVAKEAVDRDAIERNREFVRRESAISDRENLVTNRNRDADEREKKLVEREESVRKETRRVQDLYTTFIRNQKRNPQK